LNGFFEFINAYPRLLFYIAECIYQEPQTFCNRTKKAQRPIGLQWKWA
jgi:hypothetical protein